MNKKDRCLIEASRTLLLANPCAKKSSQVDSAKFKSKSTQIQMDGHDFKSIGTGLPLKQLTSKGTQSKVN